MDDILYSHCKSILNAQGYVVIHKDRLVQVGAMRRISPGTLEAMRVEFLPQFKAHLWEQAMFALARELHASGAVAESELVDDGASEIRWEALVVLPKPENR